MADWSMVVIRFVIYAVLTVLFGLAAFGLYGLGGAGQEGSSWLRPWLIGNALFGLLLSFCWLVLMAAAMAGVPPWPVDMAAIKALLMGSSTGLAWKMRVAALAVAGIAAIRVTDRSLWLGVVVLSSGGALVTVTWTGHGAMDDGPIGWAHLIADSMHLIAASIWVGALLGLLLLLTRSSTQIDSAHLDLTHRALHGFGTVGTIVVGVIMVTGIGNAWLLVGIAHVATLGTTFYGQLLIAKLVLFTVMLVLASLNRFRLTPTFERSIAANDYVGARASLQTSLAIETVCIVAILALVAWLGTLEPMTSAT